MITGVLNLVIAVILKPEFNFQYKKEMIISLQVQQLFMTEKLDNLM